MPIAKEQIATDYQNTSLYKIHILYLDFLINNQEFFLNVMDGLAFLML